MDDYCSFSSTFILLISVPKIMPPNKIKNSFCSVKKWLWHCWYSTIKIGRSYPDRRFQYELNHIQKLYQGIRKLIVIVHPTYLVPLQSWANSFYKTKTYLGKHEVLHIPLSIMTTLHIAILSLILRDHGSKNFLLDQSLLRSQRIITTSQSMKTRILIYLK